MRFLKKISIKLQQDLVWPIYSRALDNNMKYHSSSACNILGKLAKKVIYVFFKDTTVDVLLSCMTDASRKMS